MDAPIVAALQASNANIVRCVLMQGVDPNTTVNGRPLLSFAQHSDEMFTMLVRAGARVDALGERGLLHWAVDDGDADAIDRLIAAGAPIEARDASGATPLFQAFGLKRPQAATCLMRAGADLFAADDEGFTIPLLLAASNGSMVHVWSDAGGSLDVLSPAGHSPLFLSLHLQSFSAALRMLQCGADPSIRNADGDTPLALVVSRDDVAMVEVLLARGADPNIADSDGDTPLHIASFHKHLDCLQLLAANGASLNAVNNAGLTPLHVAVRLLWDEGIDALLRWGACADTIDACGETPLRFAKRNGLRDIAARLITGPP